jgi:hypothetical protein
MRKRKHAERVDTQKKESAIEKRDEEAGRRQRKRREEEKMKEESRGERSLGVALRTRSNIAPTRLFKYLSVCIALSNSLSILV